ncbi:3-ketoacyl-CoA synthase 11 [Hordeum vulgare]|nr:3-ketoacyl-CoA synthase 11 [Hordeum vulgare]
MTAMSAPVLGEADLLDKAQIWLAAAPPCSHYRAATTAKFKPNPKSRFLADEMEALQERMLQEFVEIRAAQGKLTLVDGICEQLAALNAKLSEHTVCLDQVQMKDHDLMDAKGHNVMGFGPS